jgi:hypothetical protein
MPQVPPLLVTEQGIQVPMHSDCEVQPLVRKHSKGDGMSRCIIYWLEDSEGNKCSKSTANYQEAKNQQDAKLSQGIETTIEMSYFR